MYLFSLLASFQDKKTGNPGSAQLTSSIVIVTGKAKQHDRLCYCCSTEML